MTNEPIDILAIASARVFYANDLIHMAGMANYSANSQKWVDYAWAEKCIADADMAKVYQLIMELSQ